MSYRRFVRSFLLPGTTALACIPLTSCFGVVDKTDAAATEAIPVRAVRAATEDVPLEIAAIGNVEAINSVDVKSRVAGQIEHVAFVEGQNVSKDQLLFKIDSQSLDRQILEEQANLDRDIAMEHQARAVIARDTAAEKQSQSEADTARQLGSLGVISEQRVSQLVATSDSSRAALHADQAALEAASSLTKTDRARLAETQLQLHFTDVAAPISGRAGIVTVKAGNMARDNETTLVTLRQLAPIYVTFGIPEQSLVEVRRLNAMGQLAVEANTDTVDTSASENPSHMVYGGRLVFIDNTVDATTGTIRLKAVFPNTDDALWPGEFVHVRLRLGMDADKTVVPESAVQNGLDGKYVWRVQSSSVSMAPVTVLRNYRPPDGPEQAIIGSGIRSGDVVVTEGQLRLTTGSIVALLNTPATPPSDTNR